MPCYPLKRTPLGSPPSYDLSRASSRCCTRDGVVDNVISKSKSSDSYMYTYAYASVHVFLYIYIHAYTKRYQHRINARRIYWRLQLILGFFIRSSLYNRRECQIWPNRTISRYGQIRARGSEKLHSLLLYTFAGETDREVNSRIKE